jgi:hypothetical protein
MRVLMLMLTMLVPATAFATVILPADFSTVVNGADVIVSGRVVDIRSQLTDSRSIESLVTVAISETLKGTATSTITFRVPNGTVGRYRRITIGAPEFAQGDRVVLFLRSRAPIVPTLFGLGQGVYRIAATDAGEMVLPAPMMARGIGAERVVRGDPARRPLPLPEFLAAVRASLVVR